MSHLFMTQANELRQLTGREVAALLAAGMRWPRDFSSNLRFLESAPPGARLLEPGRWCREDIITWIGTELEEDEKMRAVDYMMRLKAPAPKTWLLMHFLVAQPALLRSFQTTRKQLQAVFSSHDPFCVRDAPAVAVVGGCRAQYRLLLVAGGRLCAMVVHRLLRCSGQHPDDAFKHGTVMLSRRKKVYFMDEVSATSVATFEHNAGVNSVAIDPTGRFVADGSWDGTAQVWRLSPHGTAATFVTTLAHGSGVQSVAFDTTGSFVATGSFDNTAKVWRMSPDGTAATCVATLEGHSYWVRSVAFDPTGSFVATGSADNTAKVWRMSSDGSAATCVATLEGHSKTVIFVAFDPTGSFVATSSYDNTAKVWRMSPDGTAATCVATLAGQHIGKYHSFVYSVSFDPTGRFLATSIGSCTAQVFSYNAG